MFSLRRTVWALSPLCFLEATTEAFAPNSHHNVVASRRNDATSSTSLSLFGALNEGKKLLVKKLAGDYDESAIRARLDRLVKENPVVMLSFTTCPFCIKAKAILDAKEPSFQYTVVELDQDADGKAIRAVMGDLLGRTSVPAIWIDGKFIGGCNDGPLGGGIVQLNESGELDTMLRAAKVI